MPRLEFWGIDREEVVEDNGGNEDASVEADTFKTPCKPLGALYSASKGPLSRSRSGAFMEGATPFRSV